MLSCKNSKDKDALAAFSGAMSQSYKVDNVGEILQVDDDVRFNETITSQVNNG